MYRTKKRLSECCFLRRCPFVIRDPNDLNVNLVGINNIYFLYSDDNHLDELVIRNTIFQESLIFAISTSTLANKKELLNFLEKVNNGRSRKTW